MLADFFYYDLGARLWVAVAAAGPAPAARYCVGMAAVGSDVYVSGGAGHSGASRGGRAGGMQAVVRRGVRG